LLSRIRVAFVLGSLIVESNFANLSGGTTADVWTNAQVLREISSRNFCQRQKIQNDRTNKSHHGEAHALEVHHIFPLHFCVALGRPDLELDERNLMTLCADKNAGNHHLLVGHFDDYESMNLHARNEAVHMFHGLSATQILANIDWHHRAPKRPKHLGAMNAEQRRDLRELMDATFVRE